MEVNRLLLIYRSYTGDEPMAGGCQTLLMKSEPEALLQACRSESLFAFDSTRRRTFDGLAICEKLFIFSFLQPSDLCRCCLTNKEWHLLSNDEVLWRRLLARKNRQWERISDDRNPDFYSKACADIPSKSIYLHCHPSHPSSSNPMFSPRLPGLLHYLFRPKIVMFGPGLDSATSRLVRSILTDQQLKSLDDHPRFQVTGMVPGQFAGIGSGISLKLSDHCFNLVTLYGNIKSTHLLCASTRNRVFENRLFDISRPRRDGPPLHYVKPVVQELLRGAHGFIFVVDAISAFEEISWNRCELEAMLCELWAPLSTPLLVLACCHRPDRQMVISPAIDISRLLRLGRMGRKWMTQSGDVETLKGIREGFLWLLEEAVGASLFSAIR